MRILFPNWSYRKNACYLVREHIIGIIGYLELAQDDNSKECLKKAIEAAKRAHGDVEELFKTITAEEK